MGGQATLLVEAERILPHDIALLATSDSKVFLNIFPLELQKTIIGESLRRDTYSLTKGYVCARGLWWC